MGSEMCIRDSKAARGGQPAPAVPVFRIPQGLVETAEILEDSGSDQHDAAIDDEVSAEQRPKDEPVRLFAATDEVATADLCTVFIDTLVIAINGNDIRAGDAGAKRRDGARLQAVIGIEKHRPLATCLRKTEIANGGNALPSLRPGKQFNARIGKTLHLLRGAISGTVIDRQHLADGFALKQCAFDRFHDVTLAIANGDDNRNGYQALNSVRHGPRIRTAKLLPD